MSKNRGKKFIELLNKREKLEGTRIYGMLLSLGTSLSIVNRNYEELSNGMSRYEGDLSIWYVRNRRRLHSFLSEFARLLHNYLSSIYSLIGHTQTIRKNLDNPKLDEAYFSKLGFVIDKDCYRFVRDLRNYFQHIGLPIIAARFSFEKKSPKNSRGTIKQQLLMEKEELLKWKNWHEKSKRYITSRKDIDLRPVLSEYQALIEDFYNWFFSKVMKLYSEELDEFAKIERELARLS